MDISAIIKAVLTPHEDRPGGQLIDMNPGDRLSGRVLKIENDGRVLMDLGGQRAFAQIGFPVKIGQRLQLQVVTAGSVLHLRAETGQGGDSALQTLPNPDFARLISRKDQTRFVEILSRITKGGHTMAPSESASANIRTSLLQLRAVFETIPLEGSTQQISNWIKKAVEDRGILFEKQLADTLGETSGAPRAGAENTIPESPARVLITRNIKPQLLQAQQYLAQMGGQDPVTDQLDSKDVRFLQRCVDQLLGHIDQQQGRAVASWKDGEFQQVFVHALEMPDQKKPVQLKVYYPRKGGRKAEDHQYRMSLLLDMDAIGLVRVDLAMMSRQLMIGFFVGSTEVQQLVEHHIQNVENALAGQFDAIQVNVSVSQKKIQQFDKVDQSGAASWRIDLNV